MWHFQYLAQVQVLSSLPWLWTSLSMVMGNNEGLYSPQERAKVACLLFSSTNKNRSVGIDNLPVPKTDTWETENLEKAISLDQEGASMCSLPLSNIQAQNCWQWLLLISLMQSYLPLTWDLSSQRFTVFPNWLKGLGGGLGHAVWQAMELYRNLEEEARTL
jgi:hypothetical protein